MLWLLLILNVVLLVRAIIRAPSLRAVTVAFGVVVLAATQWWFVLFVFSQVVWSMRGFAPNANTARRHQEMTFKPLTRAKSRSYVTNPSALIARALAA